MCATHFLRRNRECFCPVRVSGSFVCAHTRVGVSRKRARPLSRRGTVESVPLLHTRARAHTHETGNVRFHGSLVTSASLPVRSTYPFFAWRGVSQELKIKILRSSKIRCISFVIFAVALLVEKKEEKVALEGRKYNENTALSRLIINRPLMLHVVIT